MPTDDARSRRRVPPLPPSLPPQGNLEDFARKYKADINRDPEFRRQFQKMCTNIGVDPLASNKGFWAEVRPSAVAT